MNFVENIIDDKDWNDLLANIDTDEEVQSAKCPFVSLHLLFGVDNETNENYRGIFSFSPLRKTEMENKVAIEKP